MSTDPSSRSSRDSEASIGDPSPHLADYWQVITRRLWLVLLVFAVTTTSAIWAVSRQRVFYQASLSIQVNDPLQRTRSLTQGSRVSGMDLFIDPIQSEIEVLRASPIAMAVVDSLGLRLRTGSEDVVRSSLARNIEVADDAPSGTLELRSDGDGNRATLLSPAGETLGSAATGQLPPPVLLRVRALPLGHREGGRRRRAGRLRERTPDRGFASGVSIPPWKRSQTYLAPRTSPSGPTLPEIRPAGS